MGARSVLVLAELADAERSAIEQDCQSCNFEVTWLTSAEMVAAKLISGKFDALVVHLQTPGAARACVEARKALTRVRFPIMALADQVDDSTYNKAFRVGADDVIDLGASAQVSQRLAAIPRPSWKPAGKSRGEALIVDPDRARAEALGRLLKEAGYLIKSVRDESAAKLHLLRQSIQLVVVDGSVEDIPNWIKNGNSKEWHPTWVVRARPDQLDETSRTLNAFSNATAVNTYLGEADVLYEVNRFSQALEATAAPGRLFLYGTKVTFSTDAEAATGQAWSEHGCTYSLGVDEVIVRTLALPPSTELTLELNAPGRETPTRLRAEVTERRVFGPVQGQTAPPGFSARLTGGELEAWRAQILEVSRQRFGAAYAPVSAPLDSAVRDAPAAPSSKPKSSPRPSASGVQPALDRGLLRAGRQDAAAKNAEEPISSKSGKSDPTSSGQRLRDPASGPATKPGLQDAAPSSQPSSSQPSSSQPSSSQPSSSQPSSSKPSSPRVPNDATGAVAIARVKLISAPTAGGGNRATAPTLKSLERPPDDMPLFEGVAPISSGDREIFAESPPTTSASSLPDEAPPTTPSGQPTSSPKPPARRAATGPGAPMRPSAPATRAKATPEEASKRRSPWAGLALLGVVGAIVGAAAIASRHNAAPKPAAPTPTLSATAKPTAAEHSGTELHAPSSAAAEAATEPESPALVASATPQEAAPPPAEAEVPSDAAEPAGTAASPPDAAPDPSELAGHLGYLYVTSSADTQVFVQGKLAGKTNGYLKVFCGRKYLRLGSEPGHWQSDGVTFKIGCQAVSRVTIEPSAKAGASTP